MIAWSFVAIGDPNATQSIVLQNTSASAQDVTFDAPFSSSGDHLAFIAAQQPGTVTVQSAGTLTLSWRFAPSAAQDYLAFVHVRRAASCPDVLVRLTGSGANFVLTWAPVPVDFGYMTPGLTAQRTLTFTNTGSVGVNITLSAPSPLDFTIMGTTSFTVPANNTWPVTLNFRPQILGLRAGMMTFTTSLAAQPNGQVTLRGYGGGPDIDVSPALGFGQVAYFAASSQTRTLTVRNVGTVPVPPDPNANLRLGTITVTAANAQTTASELAVTLPASYDPMVGVLAGAPNFVDLAVRLSPASIGMKAFDVAIASNDPDEATVTVRVTADVVMLPACSHSVSPASLDFGLVGSGATREQALTIRNTGTSSCIVSDLRMASGAPAGFSVSGVASSTTIPAGGSVTARVRFAPDGATSATLTTISTSLQFQVSAPMPLVSVPVTATLGSQCLVFSPHAFDFGNIQTGCRSPSRTVTLYNVCLTAFSVSSVSSPSTELTLSTPLVPGSLVSGGALSTIAVVFRPAAAGAFDSTVRVAGTQNSQMVTYVLPMRATGTAAATRTVETFVQPVMPKADVLLVIDDSGSMGPKQMSLGNNFASLTRYATVGGVDWQLGVVTTDFSVSTAGELRGDVMNPKILRPTTPNVTALFQAKANASLAGSSLESVLLPAAMALSNPLRGGANAGFLRRDAVLGIIGITDAEDQASRSVGLILAQLRDTKERFTDVTFSAMRPMFSMPPVNCSYDSTFAGPRTAFAVSDTNGVSEEICTPDWVTALENIGKTAFGYRTTFYLNVEPDLTGGQVIILRIDGIVVDPVDARGAPVWRFDSASNAVIFEPLFVPGPGNVLTVEYSVACIP